MRVAFKDAGGRHHRLHFVSLELAVTQAGEAEQAGYQQHDGKRDQPAAGTT